MSEFADTSSFPLHSACAEGNLEKVKELVVIEGVDLNGSDNDGNKPLLKACAGGHIEVAMELLSKGGDLLAKDKDGMSALHLACAGGHIDLALELVEQGADSICKNNDGCTPLEVACSDQLREVVAAAVTSRKKSRASSRRGEEIAWRVQNAKPVIIVGMDGRAAAVVNGMYQPTEDASCGWPVYIKDQRPGIVLKFEPDPHPAPETALPAPSVWTISDGDHCVAKSVPPGWTPPCFPHSLPPDTEWEVYNPGRLMGILAAKPKRKTGVTVSESASAEAEAVRSK